MVAAKIANMREGRPSTTASKEAVSQADAANQLNVSADTGTNCGHRCRHLLMADLHRATAGKASTSLQDEEKSDLSARLRLLPLDVPPQYLADER